MADLYGRKIVYYYRELLFLAGSMLSGLAQTMGQLILFRDFSEHDLFPGQVNRGG
jgi:MFS family permease